MALEQLPGIVSFFQKDVPAAFRTVTDKPLLAEFQKSNQAVIDALNAYEKWLKSDLLPRSKGDFRIGAENYSKKLLYDEMVDTPLDRLLAIGYEDLRRNQAEFRRVAARIDPKRTPQQILEELEKDHPAAGKLLPAFRDVLGGLRAFVETHHIVTIPSQVLADRGRDAALHARADHGLHGHAGAVREGGQGGVSSTSRCRRRTGPSSRWKSTSKGSTAEPSSAPRCTKSTPAITRSFCGSRTPPPRSAS